MARAKSKKQNGNGANLGFEEKLWAAADKMRGHMDPGEYKHVVLGLIFLKYISDAFQERYEALKADKYADPEDRDEYAAENVFWVPKVARWPHLQASAKQPTIGKLIDDAMLAIEKANPTLKGVLPTDYARPTLDKHRLGELIDLVGTIGLGDAESRSKDILGRVYEYFLGKFASAEGKGGGEWVADDRSDDLHFLVSHFGRATIEETGDIPEPSSLVLGLIASSVLGLYYRRRSRKAA